GSRRNALRAILRIKIDVQHGGVCFAIAPRLSTIRTAPDARARRRQYDLIVRGIDRETVYKIKTRAGGRTQLRPGRTAVARFEHAGAADSILIKHTFAGARVNYVRI